VERCLIQTLEHSGATKYSALAAEEAKWIQLIDAVRFVCESVRIKTLASCVLGFALLIGLRILLRCFLNRLCSPVFMRCDRGYRFGWHRFSRDCSAIRLAMPKLIIAPSASKYAIKVAAPRINSLHSRWPPRGCQTTARQSVWESYGDGYGTGSIDRPPVSYLRIPAVPYPYRIRTVSSVTGSQLQNGSVPLRASSRVRACGGAAC
jgi:hypothetical protein